MEGADLEQQASLRRLVCHCCGRIFSQRMLSVHLPACLDGRRADQDDLDPRWRTAVGRAPTIPVEMLDAEADVIDLLR